MGSVIMESPTTLDVRAIIKDYLVAHGYDGLYCGCDVVGSDGCACIVDDLMPCGSSPDRCKPGYKHEDWTGENSFVISSSKEKPIL
jgi:hypothetical protein